MHSEAAIDRKWQEVRCSASLESVVLMRKRTAFGDKPPTWPGNMPSDDRLDELRYSRYGIEAVLRVRMHFTAPTHN
jgi:hypothetical protein